MHPAAGSGAGATAVDGPPISPVDRDFRRRVGYMPAESGMYQRMTARDHLVYYARLSGRGEADAGRSADALLERLGLADRAGDMVQALSNGNQQRLRRGARIPWREAAALLRAS